MSRLCHLKSRKLGGMHSVAEATWGTLTSKWQARISAVPFTTAVGAAFSAQSPAELDFRGNDVSAQFEALWFPVAPEFAFATPELHLPLGACKNSDFEQTVLVAHATGQGSGASASKGSDTAAAYQVCSCVSPQLDRCFCISIAQERADACALLQQRYVIT